jgi:hypothetical protein
VGLRAVVLDADPSQRPPDVEHGGVVTSDEALERARLILARLFGGLDRVH